MFSTPDAHASDNSSCDSSGCSDRGACKSSSEADHFSSSEDEIQAVSPTHDIMGCSSVLQTTETCLIWREMQGHNHFGRDTMEGDASPSFSSAMPKLDNVLQYIVPRIDDRSIARLLAAGRRISAEVSENLRYLSRVQLTWQHNFLDIWTALDTSDQCQLANTSRLFDAFVKLRTTFWEERLQHLWQDDSY